MNYECDECDLMILNDVALLLSNLEEGPISRIAMTNGNLARYFVRAKCIRP